MQPDLYMKQGMGAMGPSGTGMMVGSKQMPPSSQANMLNSQGYGQQLTKEQQLILMQQLQKKNQLTA